ncbi:MAG: DUF3592 domain-containing protein [Verrucomicrobiota bacterium]
MKVGHVMIPVLVGVALMAMGGLAAGYLIWAWHRATELDDWVETTSTVLASGMEEYLHRETGRPRYRLVIGYAYEFGGERYVSERVTRLGGVVSGHREKVEKWVEQNPVGSEVRCWVNPSAPEVAILKKSTKASLYTVWFPMLFFVGGAGIIVKAVRAMRSKEFSAEGSGD